MLSLDGGEFQIGKQGIYIDSQYFKYVFKNIIDTCWLRAPLFQECIIGNFKYDKIWRGNK